MHPPMQHGGVRAMCGVLRMIAFSSHLSHEFHNMSHSARTTFPQHRIFQLWMPWPVLMVVDASPPELLCIYTGSGPVMRLFQPGKRPFEVRRQPLGCNRLYGEAGDRQLEAQPPVPLVM